MVLELIAKLETAGLPGDLSRALTELIHELAPLWPDLPAIQQRRIRYRLERVIAEASNPATDAHWWPVYLDLIGQAIQRLVAYVKTRPGARELLVSCGEGEGSPKAFYLKQGFVPTGEVLGDETVLRMALA